MATLDLRAICTALANQIDTGTTRALACYELVPPNMPQFPCAIVRTATELVRYRETFGASAVALADVELEVLVMHQGTSDNDSQIAVLELLGTASANSVPNAIEADRTLGGVVGNCYVRSASGISKAVAPDGSEAAMSVISVSIFTR